MATRPAIERCATGDETEGSLVDSRVRLRRLALLFVVALLAIFDRLAWLEWREGPRFRELAARPVERRRWIDGVRGRILSRDGIVLAEDRPVASVAVDYRWLVDTPDAAWLRRVARQRLARRGLSRQQQRESARLAAEIETIRAEHRKLPDRLAAACGIEPAALRQRTRAIERQVTEMSDRVNARRSAKFLAEVRQRSSQGSSGTGAWSRLREIAGGILFPADPPSPPARIVLAEALADHIVVEGVGIEVVAQIEAHPDDYPGTRIVQQSRRAYPAGDRAAHLVGHFGAVTASELAAARPSDSSNHYLRETDLIGRLGVERQYETALRGEPGIELEAIDLSGKILSKRILRGPTTGRDVVLTIDAALQSTAEGLLEAALARRAPANPGSESERHSGGAIVVLDARNGAILAAASAPRFDPATFQHDEAKRLAYLSAPAAPLLDRSVKMALPPGSIFKVVSAIALLEQEVVRPGDSIECRGYLLDPSRERCAIFTRHGEGHGPVTLEEALVQSCNVYFFHHAEQLGIVELVNWARRCGFGERTGVDLPDEAAGSLPSLLRDPAANQFDRIAEARAAAIGQATITATPMQVARLMAAIANGGRLVTPRVVSGWGLESDPGANGRAGSHQENATNHSPRMLPIAGLHTSTLDAVRRALVRVVADPQGSAHGSVFLEGLSIAGKTGTAETGEDQSDHAWFAGYAPAEAPQVAFAVALEHAGGGGEAAAPVARRLVQRLAQLGYCGRGGVARASHQEPLK